MFLKLVIINIRSYNKIEKGGQPSLGYNAFQTNMHCKQCTYTFDLTITDKNNFGEGGKRQIDWYIYLLSTVHCCVCVCAITERYRILQYVSSYTSVYDKEPSRWWSRIKNLLLSCTYHTGTHLFIYIQQYRVELLRRNTFCRHDNNKEIPHNSSRARGPETISRTWPCKTPFRHIYITNTPCFWLCEVYLSPEKRCVFSRCESFKSEG